MERWHLSGHTVCALLRQMAEGSSSSAAAPAAPWCALLSSVGHLTASHQQRPRPRQAFCDEVDPCSPGQLYLADAAAGYETGSSNPAAATDNRLCCQSWQLRHDMAIVGSAFRNVLPPCGSDPRVMSLCNGVRCRLTLLSSPIQQTYLLVPVWCSVNSIQIWSCLQR